MCKHSSGVFAWRPCGTVQNSMSINELDGNRKKLGGISDDVQGDYGPLFISEVQADF